jgi:hypothetical protein
MRPTAVGADLSTVIAGLDTASRVYPTCGTSICGTRASPNSDAIHPFNEMLFLMDARVISAFTRVFDALCPGMTSQRLRPLR